MCVEQAPLCGRSGLKADSGESANTGTCFDPTGKWQESYWVTGFTSLVERGAKRETVFLKNTGCRGQGETSS